MLPLKIINEARKILERNHARQDLHNQREKTIRLLGNVCYGKSILNDRDSITYCGLIII